MVLLAALKDNRRSHDDMKENLRFNQLPLNYINNQIKTKET